MIYCSLWNVSQCVSSLFKSQMTTSSSVVAVVAMEDVKLASSMPEPLVSISCCWDICGLNFIRRWLFCIRRKDRVNGDDLRKLCFCDKLSRTWASTGGSTQQSLCSQSPFLITEELAAPILVVASKLYHSWIEESPGTKWSLGSLPPLPSLLLLKLHTADTVWNYDNFSYLSNQWLISAAPIIVWGLDFDTHYEICRKCRNFLTTKVSLRAPQIGSSRYHIPWHLRRQGGFWWGDALCIVKTGLEIRTDSCTVFD